MEGKTLLLLLSVMLIILIPSVHSLSEEYVCCYDSDTGYMDTQTLSDCAENSDNKLIRGMVSNTWEGTIEEKSVTPVCTSVPKCQHEVQSMYPELTYCECDSEVISTQEGGYCESALDVFCDSEDLSDCSNNKQIGGIGLINGTTNYTYQPPKFTKKELAFSYPDPKKIEYYDAEDWHEHVTKILKSSSGVSLHDDIDEDMSFQNTLFESGFWFYINEDKENVRFFGLADDEARIVLYEWDWDSKRPILKEFGEYYQNCHILGNENSQNCDVEERRNLHEKYFTVGQLPKGWYLMKYTYSDWSGIKLEGQMSGFILRMYEDEKNKKLGEFFDVISDVGPIKQDADILGKDYCENNYINKNWDWIDIANPALIQRQCCGDDPEDFGFSRNGKTCTINGYQEINNQCIYPNGTNISNTNFNYEISQSRYYDKDATDGSDACCGDDALSNTQNKEPLLDETFEIGKYSKLKYDVEAVSFIKTKSPNQKRAITPGRKYVFSSEPIPDQGELNSDITIGFYDSEGNIFRLPVSHIETDCQIINPTEKNTGAVSSIKLKSGERCAFRFLKYYEDIHFVYGSSDGSEDVSWYGATNLDISTDENIYSKEEHILVDNFGGIYTEIPLTQDDVGKEFILKYGTEYPSPITVNIYFQDVFKQSHTIPAESITSDCFVNDTIWTKIQSTSSNSETSCKFSFNNPDIKHLYINITGAEKSESKLNFIKLGYYQEESNPSEIRDLGYTDQDNRFACFDNSYEATPTLAAPENSFMWRYAPSYAYTIMQAKNTQYISNGDKWYYCDASGEELFNAIPIESMSTFESTIDTGKILCSDAVKAMLSKVSGFDTVDVEQCYEGLDTCISNNLGEGLKAFCVGEEDDEGNKKPLAYDPLNSDEYDACLNNCYIKDDASAGSYPAVLSSKGYSPSNMTREELCLSNPALEMCIYGRNYEGNVGTQDVNPDICWSTKDAEICLEEYYDSTNSCEDIFNAMPSENRGVWFDGRVLNLSNNEYCRNGFTVYSTEEYGEPAPQCCLGEEAYSDIFQKDQCEKVGGLWREEKEAQCMGELFTNNCCVNGIWSTEPTLFVQDYAVNESFMCYQESNNNNIQECCAAGKCKNSQNPLNMGDKFPVYSYEGVSLRTVTTYDLYGENPKKQARKFLELNEKTPFELSGTQMRITDWSNYDELIFDMQVNSEKAKDLIIYTRDNESEHNYTYPEIYKYSKTKNNYNRVNRYVIPLDSLGSDEQVQSVKITFSGSGASGQVSNSVAIFDNFHLKSDQVGMNNDSYCSGEWREWVTELDGPDNEGYFNNADAGLSDFGPNMFACNAQGPFAWTGSLCCGDDSLGDQEEYFLDSEGLCWGGTPVRDDQTITYARGLETDLTDSSILVYDDEVWLCGMDASILNEKEVNFGDGPTQYGVYEGRKNGVNVTGNVVPFTIKGSWICDPTNEWVKLEEYSRVRLMASTFLAAAKESPGDEFTIFCGDKREVANNIPAALDDSANDNPIDVIDNICVMHYGSQQETESTILSGEIFMGIEVSREVPIETFTESILAVYNPFWEISEEDKALVDCSQINSDEEYFFEVCEVENSNDFVIYYNRPFNMIMIGSTGLDGDSYEPQGLNFVEKIWNDFIRFFQTLFGKMPDYDKLMNFSETSDITDIYIANADKKTIKGIKEQSGTHSIVKVDYTNLASSVEILAEALYNLNKEKENTIVVYEADGYDQTIYAESHIRAPIDWTPATSILRIIESNDPVDHGKNITKFKNTTNPPGNLDQ